MIPTVPKKRQFLIDSPTYQPRINKERRETMDSDFRNNICLGGFGTIGFWRTEGQKLTTAQLECLERFLLAIGAGTGRIFVPIFLQRRALESTTRNDGSHHHTCYLLESKPSSEQDPDQVSSKQNQKDEEVQENFQFIMKKMVAHQDFSVDHLRSLYVSLLSGLNGGDGEAIDVERMIDESIANIDTHGDDIIDALEMESINMPHESGEFLFEDVVACTSSLDQEQAGSAAEECITVANLVDFLNMFYGGTKVVSDDMVQFFAQLSGDDMCFTRSEFEAAFSVPDDKEELSAGVLSHGNAYESSLLLPSVALAMTLWSMLM